MLKWKSMHQELIAVFEENLEHFDFTDETYTGPCVIGAVQTHIAELATMAELQHLDSTFKTLYKDHFPSDIPHVKDLLHDVYHNIELQLGAPVSVA